MNSTQKKILVVDDEPDILGMVARILSDSGYAVTTATGHKEFMSSFNDVLPDLVVIDVRLPEHDGFWIAERVKSTYDIPIIFMTARHRPMYHLYAPIAGAASYINKPFEPELLLNEVKKALTAPERKSNDESPQLSLLSRPGISGTALTSE
jgi:two-component system alkaline phosphatase synthesis response regulator PhoP